jgi:hypothetical protein
MLSEQEVIALKSLIQSIRIINLEKYGGLSTGQIQLLKEIDKRLPDFFRAYNSDEELS